MTNAQINARCSETYGCGIAALPATAVLWLADAILSETGENVWKKIARIRDRHGVYTAFPAYGTPLFQSL